jgi:hypothetical protein
MHALSESLVAAKFLHERPRFTTRRPAFVLRPFAKSPRTSTVYFEIIGIVEDIETIAVGASIREVARLRARHGAGRWRKKKGVAVVRLASGRLRRAELHWYEAHGIGRRKLKIKRFLD